MNYLKQFAIPLLLLLAACSEELTSSEPTQPNASTDSLATSSNNIPNVSNAINTSSTTNQTSSDSKQDQIPQIQYSTSNWKNGATGAYAIIFDDYCNDGTNGIQDLADTIAFNRGVVIGFGIITSQCEEEEWKRAREMIANGHEVIDHSHSHRCGVFQDGWCEDVWGPEDYALEIDTSTTLIESNTGVRPRFFIFPYDLATNSHLSYLKAANYLGSRTGPKLDINEPDFTDPFKLKFDVNFPEKDKKDNQGFTLNAYIDEAIRQGGFALREVHGVDDESWGVVQADTLRKHFSYVQTKVQANEIWNANVSEIVKYRMAARYCTLTTLTATPPIQVRFTGENSYCKEDFEQSILFEDLKGQKVYLEDQEVLLQNGFYNLKNKTTYTIR